MTNVTNPPSSKRLAIFVSVLIVLMILFYVLSTTGYWDLLENTAQLKTKIQDLGSLGPVMIIVAIALAIVMSPIPSAPIALVSGALYGHDWGGLYVLIGASLGAMTAFLITRLSGYDFLQRWFGGKLSEKWIGSQNALMAIVFFSRLMPFISFDFISYVAGLTTLSFWRFAIATVAGIAPASFFLAHFGEALSSAQGERIAVAILILGLITAAPFAYRFVRNKFFKT